MWGDSLQKIAGTPTSTRTGVTVIRGVTATKDVGFVEETVFARTGTSAFAIKSQQGASWSESGRSWLEGWCERGSESCAGVATGLTHPS